MSSLRMEWLKLYREYARDGEVCSVRTNIVHRFLNIEASPIKLSIILTGLYSCANERTIFHIYLSMLRLKTPRQG